MSIEEKKEKEKQQRRDQIVDAAEKVIFAKGIDQTTMDEIAEEAGLSKGTLYLYFKNKNELYIAICERGSNILNQRFTKLFASNHSGIELIRRMGETYLDFVRDNPGYFNAFIFYETIEDVSELKESEMAQTCEQNIRDAMSYMMRALQIGMQDGTVNPSYNPRELALIIWASTRGIIMVEHMKEKGHYFSLIDEMDVELSSMFESFLNLMKEGISTEGKEKND
jgi:AcrR family transcriptional regulator